MIKSTIIAATLTLAVAAPAQSDIISDCVASAYKLAQISHMDKVADVKTTHDRAILQYDVAILGTSLAIECAPDLGIGVDAAIIQIERQRDVLIAELAKPERPL